MSHQLPTVMYHATYPTHADQIRQEGLRAGTYFANTPGYAVAFLAMRGGVEIVGTKVVEFDGIPTEVPDTIVHTKVVVFAVMPDRLPIPPVPSFDHVAGLYPDDLECYVSQVALPAISVTDYDIYDISQYAAK